MNKTIKLDIEKMQALLSGRKLEFIEDEDRITIYPPRYGKFIDFEDIKKLKCLVIPPLHPVFDNIINNKLDNKKNRTLKEK